MARKTHKDNDNDTNSGATLAEIGSPEHVANMEAQNRLADQAMRGEVAPPSSTNSNGEEKPQESKAERFKRLAVKRVPKAVKAIGAITNLANRAQYEWTEEQKAKIVKTIKDSVAALENRFQGTKDTADSFTL